MAVAVIQEFAIEDRSTTNYDAISERLRGGPPAEGLIFHTAGFDEERVDLRCEECSTVFTLSERRARSRDRAGMRVLCHDCQHPAVLAPSSRERLWVGRLDRETRESAFAGLAALRA